MALSIQDASYSYGKAVALKNFSSCFEPGAVTALLGPNGAGKSTLFKLISGLIRRQSGDFSLDGESWTSHSPKIFQKFGFVFQEPALDSMRSGLANLKYAAGLHGLDRPKTKQRIEETTSLMNCSSYVHRDIRTLSGGERRRIEIARALIHKPKWLLLDEPSAGLDINSRSKLSLDLHSLASNKGLGILWCTHVTDELCPQDALVILINGENRYSGSCGSQDEMIRTYNQMVDKHG
jgi:ABC-2 type transport system ATP-binding protein